MTAVLAAPPAAEVAPGGLLLEVTSVADAAPAVRTLALRRPDGGLLPGHPAGPHLVLSRGDPRKPNTLNGDGVAA
ncbi:hypothetical protein ACI79D_13850, partial [Geodermatophilus sp. SYSU D00708]